MYNGTTILLIITTNVLTNKRHMSQSICTENFDNLFIENKNWFLSQKFVYNSTYLYSSISLLIRSISACNNDSCFFFIFETIFTNETREIIRVTNNVNWWRSRNKMTQRRIAVKIKGTEDFVAWQKAVGIFKVLVITKFSSYLQRPTSIFCRSANRLSFLSIFAFDDRRTQS